MNKFNISYGIVLFQLASCSFPCTLSLYWQCVYLHRVIGWPKRTIKGNEYSRHWRACASRLADRTTRVTRDTGTRDWGTWWRDNDPTRANTPAATARNYGNKTARVENEISKIKTSTFQFKIYLVIASVDEFGWEWIIFKSNCPVTLKNSEEHRAKFTFLLKWATTWCILPVDYWACEDPSDSTVKSIGSWLKPHILNANSMHIHMCT